MACGTPILAFRNGSIPELLDHGVSGLIVDTVEEAAAAVERIHLLERAAVHACFEERFLVERMVIEYLAIYEAVARRPQGVARNYRRFVLS